MDIAVAVIDRLESIPSVRLVTNGCVSFLGLGSFSIETPRNCMKHDIPRIRYRADFALLVHTKSWSGEYPSAMCKQCTTGSPVANSS